MLKIEVDAQKSGWVDGVIRHALEQAKGLRQACRDDDRRRHLAARIKYLGDLQKQLTDDNLVIALDLEHSPYLSRELRAVATNIRSSYRLRDDDVESDVSRQAAFLNWLAGKINPSEKRDPASDQ